MDKIRVPFWIPSLCLKNTPFLYFRLKNQKNNLEIFPKAIAKRFLKSDRVLGPTLWGGFVD